MPERKWGLLGLVPLPYSPLYSWQKPTLIKLRQIGEPDLPFPHVEYGEHFLTKGFFHSSQKQGVLGFERGFYPLCS